MKALVSLAWPLVAGASVCFIVLLLVALLSRILCRFLAVRMTTLLGYLLQDDDPAATRMVVVFLISVGLHWR